MPQAWPSKPDGSLAAMMLGVDDEWREPPVRGVRTPGPSHRRRRRAATRGDGRPARGSPCAPGRGSALSA
ncbi:hypothetical protein CFB52_033735 [Burkholderia sp. AU18528]|nr:hypothetical protein CFB52_033735 [Burkholderia sp. AU18528]